MFEQWLSAGEDWKQSKIYIRQCSQSGQVDSDARDWLTLGELENKMGKAAAESMVKFLEANRPHQCRDHTDAPGVKDPDVDFWMTPAFKTSWMLNFEAILEYLESKESHVPTSSQKSRHYPVHYFPRSADSIKCRPWTGKRRERKTGSIRNSSSRRKTLIQVLMRTKSQEKTTKPRRHPVVLRDGYLQG